MKFAEKLQELTRGRNRSEIARSAGLSSTAIADYVSKGYIPRADKALALARALHVPLEWLIDDDQGWPPPDPSVEAKAGIGFLSDRDLILHFLLRRRSTQINLAHALGYAGKVNWAALREQLAQLGPEDHPTLDLHSGQMVGRYLAVAIYRITLLSDVKLLEKVYERDLPADGYPPEQLDQEKLLARYRELVDDPNYRAVVDELAKRPKSQQQEMELRIEEWGAAHSGVKASWPEPPPTARRP